MQPVVHFFGSIAAMRLLRAWAACVRLHSVFARRPPPLWCVSTVWWPGSLADRAMAKVRMAATAAGVGRPSAARI